MQRNESVPSILESEATGKVAEIYADIRQVLGTSIVNLIWRNLATIPDAPACDRPSCGAVLFLRRVRRCRIEQRRSGEDKVHSGQLPPYQRPCSCRAFGAGHAL